MSSVKNYTLSWLKGIGCLLVVWVHFPFEGSFGEFVSCLGQMFVYLFFMISGFFSFDETEELHKKKIASHLRKNIVFLLVCLCIYAVFTYLLKQTYGTLDSWLSELPEKFPIFQIFVLGNLEIINGGHLWFMLALIYAYLVLLLIEKKDIWSITYKAIPVLFIISFLIDYMVKTNGMSWHWKLNFITKGVPYVLMGHYISEYKNKIERYATFVLGIGVTTVLLQSCGGIIQEIKEPLFVCGLFLFSIKYPNLPVDKFFVWVGDNCSRWVYVLHIMIGIILKKLWYWDSFPYHNVVLPLIIAVVSLITAFFIHCGDRVCKIIKKACYMKH